MAGTRPRSKAQKPAVEPTGERGDTAHVDPAMAHQASGKVDDVRIKPSSEARPVSREALALLQTYVLPSGAADKARGRPSAPEGKATRGIGGRARKGMSDPPAPDRLQAGQAPVLQLQQQQQGQLDSQAANMDQPAAKGASSKRAASDDLQQEADAARPQGAKKQRRPRNVDPTQQQQNAASTAAAGASDGANGPDSAGAGAGPSSAGPAGSKGQTSQSQRDEGNTGSVPQPQPGADGLPVNGGEAGGAASGRRQAAGSGAAKKSKNAKAQYAAPGVGQSAESGPASRPEANEAIPSAPLPARLPDLVGGAIAAASRPSGNGGRRAQAVAAALVGASAVIPSGGSASTAHDAAAAASLPEQRATGLDLPQQLGVPPRHGAGLASGAAAAAVGSGSIGSAGQPGVDGVAGQAAPGVLAAASRPLPATGTTPIRPFAPIPIPRLDEIGQRERCAVIELQRQLAELRVQYDDLKASKIHDLEKVLAEQVEYTQEQVQHVEQRARLWQAAAEHAEQKALAAGSQESTDKIAALQAENEQLLSDKGELLLHVTQLERELAVTQHALHDLRAASMPRGQEVAAARGEGSADAADGAMEEDQQMLEAAAAGQGTASGDGAPVQEASPASHGREVGGATPEAVAALLARATAAGRAVGMQFPTPSPGIGVQFPTPGMNLMRLQGFLGSMLTAPGSGSRSTGPGVSKECPRVVQMLPHLGMPTPSVQSQHASGAVPFETQAAAVRLAGEAVTTATPHAASAAAETHTAALTANMSRHSTGSPIDGICGTGQRTTGANLAADVSFAHGMGAPEAYVLGPKQQDQYSFVDLNPASARKAERPAQSTALAVGTTAGGIVHALAAVAGDDTTQQGLERRTSAVVPSAAALVATAAAVLLPPSPGASLKGTAPQVTLVTAGGGILQNARSPYPRQGRPLMAVLSPSRRPEEQVPAHAHTANGNGASPGGSGAAAPAVINSGSIVSNQDSCTVSGLVARAMAQQHVHERQAGQQHNVSAARAAETDGPGQQGTNQAAAGGEVALVSRSPASASHRPGSSPGRGKAGNAEAAGDVGQPTDDLHSAGARPQLAVPSSPSPRTAKIMTYERMLDWHVDTVSLKPETCRLSHKASGMTFELRETLLDDEEAEAEMLQDGQAGGTSSEGSKCFTYTPLELGLAAGSIPSFLKETIQISALQRRELLQLLNNAIRASFKA